MLDNLIAQFDHDHPPIEGSGTFQPQSRRPSYFALARTLKRVGPVSHGGCVYHGDAWGNFRGVWIVPDDPDPSRFPEASTVEA